MMKQRQKVNLLEPHRNRDATANFVNLIMTSTVSCSLRIQIQLWGRAVGAAVGFNHPCYTWRCLSLLQEAFWPYLICGLTTGPRRWTAVQAVHNRVSIQRNLGK